MSQHPYALAINTKDEKESNYFPNLLKLYFSSFPRSSISHTHTTCSDHFNWDQNLYEIFPCTRLNGEPRRKMAKSMSLGGYHEQNSRPRHRKLWVHLSSREKKRGFSRKMNYKLINSLNKRVVLVLSNLQRLFRTS